MLLKCVIFCILLNQLNAANIEDVDATAVEYCNKFNGKWSYIDGKNPDGGFKCTVLTAHGTEPGDMLQTCKNMYPFQMELKLENNKIYCVFYVFIKCDPGWKQLDNRCVQLQPTNEIAYVSMKNCEQLDPSRDSKLFVMEKEVYRKYLTDFYFIGAVWTRLISFEQFMVPKHKEDNNIALFTYGLQSKYRGNNMNYVQRAHWEKHQYICQYTPKKTKTYFKYLMKKYAPIYPMFAENAPIFLSASKYGGSEDPMKMHETCKKVAKIFGGEDYFNAIVPSKELKNQLSENFKQHFIGPVTGGCDGQAFRAHLPNNVSMKLEQDSFHDYLEFGICDSSTVVMTRETSYAAPPGYQDKIAYDIKDTYNDCDGDWWQYNRKNSEKFCHKINPIRGPWDYGRRKCNEIGGVLTGFEDIDEAEAVYKHFYGGNRHPVRFLFGAMQYDMWTQEVKIRWLDNVSTNQTMLYAYKDHQNWPMPGVTECDGRLAYGYCNHDNYKNCFHIVQEDSLNAHYICGKYPDKRKTIAF